MKAKILLIKEYCNHIENELINMYVVITFVNHI
jgi:hypothetical protein